MSAFERGSHGIIRTQLHAVNLILIVRIDLPTLLSITGGTVTTLCKQGIDVIP